MSGKLLYRWSAWAIHAWQNPSPGAHPYVGPSEMPYGHIGARQCGFPVATFRTRRDAREALTKLRRKYRGYKTAKIVRLSIRADFEDHHP
jgi:hypothetical protein